MSELNYFSLYNPIFEQIELPDNAVVADLGCRDASFLLALNEIFVNKIKSAVGVDITDKGFKNVKYGKPIKLRVMDCSKRLDFSDNTFDFVFTKDMFECVPDKNLLIEEIHRILKPNGTVISVNCDWDSITYNGENKELITNIIHAYAATKQPWMDDIDSWIGRRMYGFFNSSQLFDSSISVYNVVETDYAENSYGYNLSVDMSWLYKENTGVITENEYDMFIENLTSAQKSGQYIFSKPYYIYKGTKL